MAKTKARHRKGANGSGGITKRADGRYMARYTTIDPETGAKVRRTIYGRDDIEVRSRLADALKDRQDGRRPVAAPTLQAWTETWLAAKAKRRRPKTVYRYGELLGYVLPDLGGHKLTSLEARHVNAVIDRLRERGLSPRTCNHVRDVLRNCLNDAIASRQIPTSYNAAAEADPITDNDDERPADWLEPQQALRLVEIAEDHPDGPLWVVTLFCGLRQSEALGLTWDNADLDAELPSIRITQTLQRMPDGRFLVQPPKSKRSRRTIGLEAEPLAALRRQRAAQAPERLRMGKKWSTEFGNLVFTSWLKPGLPLDGVTVTKRFQKALKDAGLPVIPFHGLRYSTASLLDYAGVPLREAMEFLGHSQVAVTANIYQRIEAARTHKTAASIGKALHG